jgi:hypothetical protein
MSSDPAGSIAVAPSLESRPTRVRARAGFAKLDPAIARRALIDAFVELGPRHMVRDPVMFLAETGSAATTVACPVRLSIVALSITL